MAILPEKIAELRVKQLEMVQSIVGRMAAYGANFQKLLHHGHHGGTRIRNHASTSLRQSFGAPSHRNLCLDRHAVFAAGAPFQGTF